MGLLIIFLVLGIFITLGIFLGIYKSPKKRGERGEAAVARVLGDIIPGEQYVINDLLFTTNSGSSCQIDHVFINRYGIWVIETKNYAGRIYGEENQREWTQTLANGKTVNKFYNPIKQNATHIYHLSKILHISDGFYNIVAFSPRADISRIRAENVMYIGDLRSIKRRKTATNFSAEKMEQIYNKLLSLKNGNTISAQQHVENIHIQQSRLQQGLCPRCGKALVLREGKYGKFYGCSGYPSCKFTKNIDCA